MRVIVKAGIGEGLSTCDRCGFVDKTQTFISIYHGPHGEKVDYCSKCFDREGCRIDG